MSNPLEENRKVKEVNSATQINGPTWLTYTEGLIAFQDGNRYFYIAAHLVPPHLQHGFTAVQSFLIVSGDPTGNTPIRQGEIQWVDASGNKFVNQDLTI